MPTLAKQVDYVAAAVQLKSKPTTEQLFRAEFLPPLQERLPAK